MMRAIEYAKRTGVCKRELIRRAGLLDRGDQFSFLRLHYRTDCGLTVL